ncbi:GL26858 [Drosophila persimilis]|uniref:GL26858 n=1 Tax=Drosophila persimilis TaxID=7234 RepID=B4H2L0_DROPE|nr:GL26858 [Drosophila persimilis]
MNSHDQPMRCPATDSQVIGMGDSRFEFRFSGPDSIPNAVKRHNKQRAAELAEQSRLRSDCRSNAPIFCKVRHPGRDVLGQFTSRDTDVETQFSLNSSCDNQADETGQGDKDKPQQLRGFRKLPVISKCLHSQDTSETQFFSLQSLANRKDEESVENERLVFKITEHKRLCAGCDCNPHCQAHAPSRLKKKPVYRRGYLCQMESGPSYNTSQTDEKPLAEDRQNKPIRGSEETPCGQTSQETLASPSRGHVLQRPRSYKRLLKKNPKMAHKMCTPRPRATSETDKSDELPTPALAHARQPGGGDSRNNRRQPGGRDKAILSRPPAGREKQSLSKPIPTTDTSPHQAPTVTPSPTRRRKTRPLVFSQSLEDLKYEKLGIYNKISLTQERIISALDRLQNSLLKLQVPDCNTLERKKRERNAFEFCVRFSRNFLYPLKGMIDDVRRTPVGYFNSATSNEACQRVVPQKLSALMEMIYTLSSTCVEKGILDRHDPVVECLLERSTKFLTFIEDMQEERFKMAREHYRRSQKQAHPANGNAHSSHPKHPAFHSSFHEKKPKHKYDLKMCLNDHKLYEPRLVPKKKPQDLKRSRNGPDKELRSPRPPTSKWLELRSPKTKEAEQKAQKTASRKVQKEDELQQALLEAFRHVSRDQVHQVLDPLMRSLGALLDDKVSDGLPFYLHAITDLAHLLFSRSQNV